MKTLNRIKLPSPVLLFRSYLGIGLIVFLVLAIGALYGMNRSVKAAPSLPSDPFGIYFYPSVPLQGTSQMVAAGARWSHVHIHWSEIETVQGVYNWTKTDSMLGDLAGKGFQVMVTINNNPTWAAQYSCGPIYDDHLDEFENFMSALVNRYSKAPYNVLHYTFYNEADNSDPINFPWLGGCWGRVHPNHAANAGGAAYAAMLERVYPVVKAANAQAQVVFTGMAYDWFYPTGIFDRNFFPEALAAGAGPYFDYVSVHYFHGWKGSWTTSDPYNTGLPRKVQVLRGILSSYGVTKPLIISELGHPTDAVDPAQDVKLSEDFTANLVVQFYSQAMATGADIIVWLEAVDESWLDYSHGLMRANLSKKLSYDAYKVLTTELAGAQFQRLRRDLPAAIEGYDFLVNSKTTTVLWVLESQSTPRYQSFPVETVGNSLRVVEKFGNVTNVVDGSSTDTDGARNGFVRISIDHNPRYVSSGVSTVATSTPTATPNSGGGGGGTVGNTCNGLTATILGTAGNDIIKGTNSSDVIVALGGNDTIYGYGGQDVICGGEGNDVIFGHGSDDIILGEDGDDAIDGNNGSDSCNGGSGSNTFTSCESQTN